MKVTLRRATLQDCHALCEIHVSSIRGLASSHHTEEEIAAWSGGRTPDRYAEHIAERHVIIAEDGSIAVGFGTLDLLGGELVQLYVRPDYARRGVGSRILDELLGIARSAGLREVHCLASLNARSFYVDAGFRPGQKCKHRFRDGGEVDCVPMSKQLESACEGES